MTRDELQSKLTMKGVHESLYTLDGLSKQSECYSIVQEGELWNVVYKERGRVREIATGLRQGEAYEFLYREFQNIYGWKS